MSWGFHSVNWSLAQAVTRYQDKSQVWLMEPIAPYLERWEVVCRCGCGEWELTRAGLYLWTAIRVMAGVPLFVNSGRRCQAHNQAVRGETNSLHLMGAALDISWPSQIPREIMFRRVSEIVGNGGLGVYHGFFHADTGEGYDKRRRWSGT